jgi:hypothetical protein
MPSLKQVVAPATAFDFNKPVQKKPQLQPLAGDSLLKIQVKRGNKLMPFGQ